jgi:hypothetical protein
MDGIGALCFGLSASRQSDQSARRIRVRQAKDGSYITANGRRAFRSQREPWVMWIDAEPDDNERLII